jgi:hypothetical protein
MNRRTDFGYGHDDLFRMNLNRSVRGGFLGFGVMAVVTTAAAVMIVLLLAGAAPDEKHRNTQNND